MVVPGVLRNAGKQLAAFSVVAAVIVLAGLVFSVSVKEPKLAVEMPLRPYRKHNWTLKCG